MAAVASSAGTDTGREIVVTRVIEARRQVVFDAFTDPERLGRWWGPNGSRVTTHSFDFRPGGIWDATIHRPNGAEYPSRIEWSEIVPPERIVWIYGTKGDPQAVMTTLTLVDRGPTTEATLQLLFSSAAEREKAAKHHAVEGARYALEQLTAFAQEDKR